MKKRIFSILTSVILAVSCMTLPVHAAEEDLGKFGVDWTVWDCGIDTPGTDVDTEMYVWVSEFRNSVSSIGPYSERAFENLPYETDETVYKPYVDDIMAGLKDVVDTDRVYIYANQNGYQWTYDQLMYGKEYFDSFMANPDAWLDATKQPIPVLVTYVQSGTTIKGSDFSGCELGLIGEFMNFGPFYAVEKFDEYLDVIHEIGLNPTVIEGKEFDINKTYSYDTLVHLDMGDVVLSNYDELADEGDAKLVAPDNVISGEIKGDNGLNFDRKAIFCDIDGYPAIDDCMYIDPGVNLCMFKVPTQWGTLEFYEAYIGIGEPIAPKPEEKVEETPESTEAVSENPVEDSIKNGVDPFKYIEQIQGDEPKDHEVKITDNPDTDVINDELNVPVLPSQVYEEDIKVSVDGVELDPHQYVVTNPVVTEEGAYTLQIDIFGSKLHGTLDVNGGEVRPKNYRSVIGKVVAGTLSFAIVGGGGYWLFLFFKRKRIKFHGVLSTEKMPNVVEKGETNDATETWFIPELMNAVNKGEMTIADYIETLLGCKVVTLLPLDSEMVIDVVASDGTDTTVYDDVADEATLFDKMTKYTDIARQNGAMYTMNVHIRVGGIDLSYSYLLR